MNINETQMHNFLLNFHLFLRSGPGSTNTYDVINKVKIVCLKKLQYLKKWHFSLKTLFDTSATKGT